jgi:protein phosphatase 1 regulatory subunit 16A
MCGHKEICKILIEHGADLLALNSDGYMPYDLCDDAITLDYIESQMYSRGITQTVIDQMRCQPERQMLTDLKHLVERNSSRSLKSIRALLSNRNDEGATPLHIASANGYSTVIEYLLQRNVSIDLQDTDRWKSIHTAAYWCQQSVICRYKHCDTH